ncbi:MULTISPECIES: type II toxin-antitoxin system RelB/DinJ family antitoxin [Vagococcus]|uniref:type II toxin-antitoxin system RelB/DinJ family antitoxin n=1 Tax=Vagococcus fluvialis TaxID=2738 RepID=UPI001D0AD7D7|nr:type II toxin-antitoxin system RelB/DinJ family antitoxin [Vagococcus fluvialis]UDM79124.1 type II toxin-antitoxin system RelB/DinJ family antitoxin [Vagococcus fluvialis]
MDKKIVQLDVEIDTELYEKADYVVNKLGFTMEDVIRSFITRVVATKGLPFDLSLTEEEKSDMREYFTEKN